MRSVKMWRFVTHSLLKLAKQLKTFENHKLQILADAISLRGNVGMYSEIFKIACSKIDYVHM